MTSSFRIIVVFVFFDLQIIFNMYYIDMFMFCLHTKFHMASCNRSLSAAIKPIAKENFRTAIMLLFYIKKNNLYISLLPHNNQHPEVSVASASVVPASSIRGSVRMLLLIGCPPIA
jgi:hypothetical protein